MGYDREVTVVLAFSLKGKNNLSMEDVPAGKVVLAFSLKGKNNTGMAIRK